MVWSVTSRRRHGPVRGLVLRQSKLSVRRIYVWELRVRAGHARARDNVGAPRESAARAGPGQRGLAIASPETREATHPYALIPSRTRTAAASGRRSPRSDSSRCPRSAAARRPTPSSPDGTPYAPRWTRRGSPCTATPARASRPRASSAARRTARTRRTCDDAAACPRRQAGDAFCRVGAAVGGGSRPRRGVPRGYSEDNDRSRALQRKTGFVEISWRRVAAATWIVRGDTAAATWLVRGGVAATPRPRRG